MTTMHDVAVPRRQEGMSAEEKRVIFASSLGTVFEWYDFYLYATLAPFFAALFFPPGNETAALLSAFATYAAGFLVRPFGAIVFGRDRRPGRPQIHVPRSPSSSWASRPSPSACCLPSQDDRLGGARSCW